MAILSSNHLAARLLADGLEAELKDRGPDAPEGTETLVMSLTLVREIIGFLRNVT